MTQYNYVPDGKGGFHEVPATPEPQSLAVKAGQANAYLSDANARALADAATVAPPVRVTTIDGRPTVIARPPLADNTNVGQRVPDEDLAALDIKPIRFPRCEVPGCGNEAHHQIISGAGKPLSINRKGQLVFDDLPPLPEAGMSEVDKARAMAGSSIVGPSGLVATQTPKYHVDVCLEHQHLPYAPKAAPKRYRSGPYKSYFGARRRAHEVGLRTRVEPEVFSRRINGADAWFVEGDDGAPGWQGKLDVMP